MSLFSGAASGQLGDSLAQRSEPGKDLPRGTLDSVGKEVSDATENRAKSVYYGLLGPLNIRMRTLNYEREFLLGASKPTRIEIE